MRSLANNPKNKLKHVTCPDCGSRNWYRKKDLTFVCKKCSKEWTEEEV